MEYEYINLTKHAIDITNGPSYPPSGIVARVAQWFESENFSKQEEYPPLYISMTGEVENLPPEKCGTRYIVSKMVLDSLESAYTSGLIPNRRRDCVAPATGHPKTVRDEKGHILSVPGFIL